MASNSPILESSKTEVVLVGRFAPDELHPKKLLEAKVLTEAEVQRATINALLPGQIVDFALDWVTVQVVAQRTAFVSSQAPYVRIADLALKTVREIMRAPAITMLGINREFNFTFTSTEARDTFGSRLAPPEAWGAWGKSVRNEFSNQLNSGKHGGLIAIQMRQAAPDDREAGWIDVTVGSSSNAASPLGVVVRVNDHYQTSESADPQSLSKDGHEASRTSRLLDALFNSFDESVHRSDAIAHELVML